MALVNLLEELMPEGERDVEWKSGSQGLEIDLDLRGFEIKTIKVWL